MASYAVVTSHEILEAYVLSGMKLAHAAELIAVTRAAILGLQVNIYILIVTWIWCVSCSRSTFLYYRGLLTSMRTTTKKSHVILIADLLGLYDRVLSHQ